jgi:uncharacterized protein with HEPN domain
MSSRDVKILLKIQAEVSEGFRLANGHIPWRSIAGLRDIAVHGYQTLRMPDIRRIHKWMSGQSSGFSEYVLPFTTFT